MSERVKYTRREVLTLALAGACITAGGVLLKDPVLDRTYEPIEEQKQDYYKANVHSEQFLEENRPFLQKIRLGCSIAPEKYFELCKENDNDYQPNPNDILRALEVIVEKLGIKEIRFALRWSNTIDHNGQISLDFYKPYLDYLIKKRINICLGVGPIRFLGWPEEDVPQRVLDNLSSLPRKSSKLTPEMPLAQAAFTHLDDLAKIIKTTYSPEELDCIKIIQGDNEPFNSFYFGKNGWIASIDYCRIVTEIIHSHFPQKKILINSASTRDFKEIAAFLNETQKQEIIPLSTFKIGIDLYHGIEDFAQWIESKSKRLIGIVDWPDIITYSKMIPEIVGDLNFLKKVVEKGIELEATEIQAEPWGRYLNPGRLLKDFQYALLRSEKALEHQMRMVEKTIVRIWGIERLVFLLLKGRTTEEQIGILKLVSTLAQ